jgi:hypothetical protein
MVELWGLKRVPNRQKQHVWEKHDHNPAINPINAEV